MLLCCCKLCCVCGGLAWCASPTTFCLHGLRVVTATCLPCLVCCNVCYCSAMLFCLRRHRGRVQHSHSDASARKTRTAKSSAANACTKESNQGLKLNTSSTKKPPGQIAWCKEDQCCTLDGNQWSTKPVECNEIRCQKNGPSLEMSCLGACCGWWVADV